MSKITRMGWSPELPRPSVSRRARMLYCPVDGRARTSTELAMVADVTPSTASVHLHRLKAQRLVRVFAQGETSLLRFGRD